MKIKYIALCLLLALVGCQRDEEMEIGQVSIGNERLEASYSSVLIGCSFQTNVTIKNVQAYLSTEADFSSVKSYSLTEKSKNTFGATIEGLKDASTYYVRYKISNRWSSKMIDKVGEFKTIPYTIPTVQTSEVSDVTHNTAIVGGVIIEHGGQEIIERGVVCGKSPNPTIENSTKVESLEKAESYACTLMDLEFATTYYARAYATNEKGTAYGEEVSFKTSSTTAAFDTLSISDVTATSAVISGALLNNGGESITALGVCYGVNQSPTLEDATVINTELDDLKFSVRLNDLQKGTTYYVRAYATNSHGTVYSEELCFNTEMTIPAVTTTPATDISYTSATVGGNVTEDGGASVTERGICYSTSANPTTANTKVTSGIGTCSFTCNLTDLQDGTTYYARAYAINAKGTAYGEEVSFTTNTKTIPTITTAQATNISYTSATVGGNVTDDGGASVTERGVVYGTSQNPTVADNKVSSGNGKGAFTCNLTNLKEATTYFVRAYAINEKGTAYGEEVSFTTSKEILLPSVTTSAVTQITETTAVAGGNVTSDGGASVSERGVVYSLSANPAITDLSSTIVRSGNGTGAFTCNLSNLQAGTTYYVRAYAINSKGTAYGDEISFTTALPITLAIVTTASITQITETTAVAGGNVTSDGGASVTERGVVYSINQNPTTADNKIPNGSGMGSFTCNLTSLQPNTTYYVRAYATNEVGTAYGEEVSLTTKVEVVDNPSSNLRAMPFSVSESKQVYFSKGNLQYHPANNEWRFAPSQLDYIGDANSNCSSTYNGWLDLFGWSTSTTNFGVSTSKSNSDYSGSFVDWGTNTIGDDAPNTWRTLTYDEWYYLRLNRTNANDLVGLAQVNGVNGLIFLPDNWTCPAGVTFKSGFNSSYGDDYYAAYQYQTFTAEQWTKLEIAGAVFLPAAGGRVNSYMSDVQYMGDYWSATEYNSSSAYSFCFYSDEAGMLYSYRFYGLSVRLVKDL